MRAVLVALAALLLAGGVAHADYYPGPISVAQTCAPVTGVLAAANATISLPCAGAANYDITITPTSGQPALVGTLTSVDPVNNNGPRLLFKAGVGALGTNTLALNGLQGGLEYRTDGASGVGAQAITLTSYTSGSATVTISASYNSTMVFVNGPILMAEEIALRAGRAFTASSGSQSLASGNYQSVVFTNPASNTMRAIITNRRISCDLATGSVAPKWYSLPNPTANLPATTAPTSNRRTGGSTSAMGFTYNSNGGTFPDTATSTPLASRTGGFVPTGGMAGGPGDVMRTVEPGQSTALTILGTGAGLATNPLCSIDVTWYEEPVN